MCHYSEHSPYSLAVGHILLHDVRKPLADYMKGFAIARGTVQQVENILKAGLYQGVIRAGYVFVGRLRKQKKHG